MKTKNKISLKIKEKEDSNFLKFMEWLENEIIIKNKREIAKEFSKVFKNKLVLIMERQKPLGVYIKLEENNENLPEDVRIFLSAVLNAAGCKLLKENLKN